jgi:hypothetical protein
VKKFCCRAGRSDATRQAGRKIDERFGACFRPRVASGSTRDPHAGDSTGSTLVRAADQTRIAAAACRAWEGGGDAGPVSDTAATAREAAAIALEAVVADEPAGDPLDDPQTRRSRLAYAGWLALLAGTDEDGESSDLLLAAHLFRRAAQA